MVDHPADIRLVFRHYPLDEECNPTLPKQVHAASCLASSAAECAGEQGKFWEYADLLFADQKEYTRPDLDMYAGAVSLDMDRFRACLNEGRTKDLVRQDLDEAQRIGIKATPTLVINGRLVEGLPSPERLALIIELEKQRTAKQ